MARELLHDYQYWTHLAPHSPTAPVPKCTIHVCMSWQFSGLKWATFPCHCVVINPFVGKHKVPLSGGGIHGYSDTWIHKLFIQPMQMNPQLDKTATPFRARNVQPKESHVAQSNQRGKTFNDRSNSNYRNYNRQPNSCPNSTSNKLQVLAQLENWAHRLDIGLLLVAYHMPIR